MSDRFALDALAWPAVAELAAAGTLVVLVPVGSTEPHGPHMGLGVDTAISQGACRRAAERLEAAGLAPRIAAPIAYGVTECAAAFAGAVSVPADVLTAYAGAVVDGLLASGAVHVCLVNSHLEPAHDRAVRRVAETRDAARVSVACPLTRRWARTLSAEFKSGACHAGQYETSIVMACAPELVDDARRAGLPPVAVSLSEKLSAGVTDFQDMGLADAYAGDPAAASAAEGHELLDRLADMIVGEVSEALGR